MDYKRAYEQERQKRLSLQKRNRFLIQQYGALKRSYIDSDTWKEQLALQQHLIQELVKSGARICKGYETINIVLPQVYEVPTTKLQEVQAAH